MLTCLQRPQLDQLSEHPKDSLVRAHALLLEKGQGNTTELEPEDILHPIPPLLLKVRGLHVKLSSLTLMNK